LVAVELMGEAVLGLATDALFVVEPDSLRLVGSNRAFTGLLGYSAAEAARLELHALLVDRRVDDLVRLLRSSGQATLGVGSFRHKDGRLVELEARAGATEAQGRPLYCFLVRDLDELERADEAERAMALRLRVLAEATFEAIGVSEGGRLVDGNAQLEVLLGAPLDELVGRSVLDFIPSEYQREMLERLRAGVTVPFEHELLTVDGARRPVEALAKTVSVAGRSLRVTALRDITERKKLEDEVRRALRMESIGRLAGGVAHDFNNLLTVILSVAKVMEQGSRDANQLADLQQISAAAERAAELTAHLLAFARKQITEPKVIDLNLLVEGIEALLRRLIGEHLALKTVCQVGLGAVRADPTQLEQVVLNLAVNARDAMEAGGTLTIETANVELGPDYSATHPEVSPGEYVMIGVSDTGEGMDASTLARVFEPFFTTKSYGKGSGLGLATCYGIVKQSGGSIWAYSEPGYGTTFKVYLPRVRAALSAPEAKLVNTPAGGHETLLLVEDDELVRRIAIRILTGHGYRVHAAADGAEALARFAELEGRIDGLITDVILPQLSAKQLVAELLRRKPKLRVLYTSGYTENTVVHQGVVDTGVNFLAKPYLPADLARAVRQMLDAEP
jgi:two-component system, cell cycle sensor histidine kinase and response regulator CckA